MVDKVVVALVWASVIVVVRVIVLRDVVSHVEKTVLPADVATTVDVGTKRVMVVVTVDGNAVTVAPLLVVIVTVWVTVPVDVDVVFALTRIVEVVGRMTVVVKVVLTSSSVVEVDVLLIVEVMFEAARAEETLALLRLEALIELRGMPLTAAVQTKSKKRIL